MKRMYRDKNWHYFQVRPKDEEVECLLCRKLYRINELTMVVTQVYKQLNEPITN